MRWRGGVGSRSLDRAASDAVRRWRFRPAVREGQAVAGTIQVPITFNLER
jgi:protein TonB